jgi:hypothetical protein
MTPTNMSGIDAFTQPTGFDTGTGTADELAQFGYPPRPDRSRDRSLVSMATMTASTVERVVPILGQTNLDYLPISALRVNERNGAIGSTNLRIRVGARSEANRHRSILFDRPPLDHTDGAATVRHLLRKSGLFAQWLGIDGFSNGNLLQSGCQADAYRGAG